MRRRIVLGVMSFVTVVAVAGASVLLGQETTVEQRLSNLETRVATLETQVATPEEQASSDQQSGNTTTSNSSQSSSSQSSSTSSNSGGTSLYAANYSGSGNEAFSFEIDNGGTFRLSADGNGPTSVQIETENGDTIDAFTVDIDEGESVEADGQLEPGAYVLEIVAEGSWNVALTSVGD